jgi:1-aminocyclopropane-1-carboxylate deaminase/D-cysteine desulfhydrase-like pyridoxal-dependent ACC family enzyme
VAGLFTDRNTQPDPNAPLTPVEYLGGNVWVKRDDYFVCAGVRGGKVRTCAALAIGARGLVTAGSRSSPQANIVSHIAQALDIPARVHVPEGKLSPELLDAQACGAEVIQHKAGYNSVIVARAHEDAKTRGWTEIPFGMECEEAIRQTRAQVRNVPCSIQRVVMPVGSGMSFCGVLWGLQDAGLDVPVVGVVVGADPLVRIRYYAPVGRRWQLTASGMDYHKPAKETMLDNIKLDPYYEAKCLNHLRPGDLFWIVGIRRTAE